MTLIPTIFLFDIDGTLISTGGAGRRAIERVFEERFGRDDACGFPFGGMTDRAIVRSGLDAIGEPADEAHIDALLEIYVDILADEVAGATTYFVHAGMHEAIDATLARPQSAVGLGTGNIERGARIKLDRVGLNERFGFGGFGCDDEDRPALIRRGAERGAQRLGRPLEACRVVIIGDTVRDVAAARALGAEVVAVATGGDDLATLQAAGADVAVPDLTDAGAMEALLHGAGR